MGPDKQDAVTNFRHDDKRPRAGKIYGELVPLNGFVYVEPELHEDKITDAGIFVAKPKYQGPPNMGKVLAIGSDVEGILVGDRVCFQDKNAQGFWLNDIAHIPLRTEQIIAIVKAEA